MRKGLLAALLLLSACQVLEGSGYRVTEVQFLFPEATERWTYFYGEPRVVELDGREARTGKLVSSRDWFSRSMSGLCHDRLTD